VGPHLPAVRVAASTGKALGKLTPRQQQGVPVHTRYLALSVIAELCLGFAAPAQDINIADNNAVFTKDFEIDRRNIYPSGAVPDFLRADPAGDAAGVIFKTAWIYRISVDVREQMFNDRPAQVVNYVNNGNVGTATWPDLDNRGLLQAVVTYRVVSTGPSSGVVICENVLTNISANPVSMTLFHFADFDLCGAGFTQNSSSSGADGRMRHTGGTCSETAEHFVRGASGWETQTSGDLYGRFADTASTTLANNMGPVGPGDVRSAFEWDNITILPGKSETFVVQMSHNDSGCGASASFYGPDAAISSGFVNLQLTFPPIIGQAAVWQGTNYVPNIPIFLVMGLTRVNVAFPGTGLTLLNDALAVSSLTSNTSTFQASVPIPGNPALCGAEAFGQFFFLDPNAPNGIGGQTSGTRLLLGNY
jgi:hypothetical protein